MTWTAHHHRDDIVREVVEAANSRRDGVLPRDIDGVSETFADDLALIGALQLKWHTRLAGRIDRALMDEPASLEDAVVAAWQATYAELGGVRLVLDGFVTDPVGEEMRHCLEVANRKDWALMAASAGLASVYDDAAAALGRGLEDRARASFVPAPVVPQQHRRTIVDRIRAVVAA